LAMACRLGGRIWRRRRGAELIRGYVKRAQPKFFRYLLVILVT